MNNEIKNSTDPAYDNLLEVIEKLKDVHTQKGLEAVQKEVAVAKERAMKESAEYQRVILRKRAEAERRAEEMRLERQREMFDLKMKANIARTQAESMRSQARMTMNMEGLPTMRSPRRSDSELSCSKCGNTNTTNIMTQGKGKRKKKVPWCFKCNLELTMGGKGNRVLSEREIRKNYRDSLYKMN